MHPDLRVVLMTGRTAEVHRAAWDGFELLPKPCPPGLLDRTLAGIPFRYDTAAALDPGSGTLAGVSLR
jgi:hypothetical protein